MSFLTVKTIERPGDNFKLEYIDKPEAVAMVLFNSNYSKIALVKQFRAGSQKEIYELPAGIVDNNEDTLAAVLREVREETGFDKVIDIVNLGEYYVSPGYTTEKIHLFVGRVAPKSVQRKLNLDEGEDLVVEWFEISEIDNTTTDMKTILGISKALAIPKKKIGIYGGTFNPITYLHLLTMERAIEEANLDLCLIEPVGDTYYKSDIIPAGDRINMLSRAIQSSEKIQIGTYEMSELIQPHTYMTLNHYKEKYGWCEIYFICGSDNLRDMKHWPNYNKIVEQFKVICIQRGDDNVYQDIILQDKYMTKNKNNILAIHENVVNNVSSSAVRNLVAGGQSIKFLVPEDVEKYIHEHRLYLD